MFTKIQEIAKKAKRFTKFGQLIADTVAYFHTRGQELELFDADEVKA